MKQIVNNNIECTSPTGKVFYSHFHWLKQHFIQFLKYEIKEEEIEVRSGLVYKILGYLDHIVIHKSKYLVKRITKPEVLLTEEYFDRLYKALEDEKEIKIRDWKFKVI